LLITPTGAHSGNLTPERVVLLDRRDDVVGSGVPSSEWEMHTAALRTFPSANAVVHTHGDACVALACLRKPLPAFHYMVAAFGGAEVRCARYATFGTVDLADSAVEALRNRTACLLANHGMIAVGRAASDRLGFDQDRRPRPHGAAPSPSLAHRQAFFALEPVDAIDPGRFAVLAQQDEQAPSRRAL
jgi:ribulose-5-phosphate 4-epimerase/fuculose-1-phosphate aldolase